MNEGKARQAIADLGKSMFERRLTFGSSGNISVRFEDGWLMTPTNVALGQLDPDRMSRLDAEGRPVSGDPPTKESALHLSMYRQRASAQAVVHLHSTHSVAVSCLADIDPEDVLPAITAYYIMRVGRLPLVPYFPPGDPALGAEIGRLASRHAALLLANHGPVVAGTSLEAAGNAIEELEETARLYLLLRGCDVRYLSRDAIAHLRDMYPIP